MTDRANSAEATVGLPRIVLRGEEDHRQFALLNTALGEPRSGMTRYAAAMYFHKSGRLDLEHLEAYRICSKLDDEDPADVLASRAGRVRNRPSSGS